MRVVCDLDSKVNEHQSVTDRLKGCSLPVWTGLTARCRWCDAELTGRRTVWCSDACSMQYATNHYWSLAKPAALKRDGKRCIQCARGWPDVTLEVNHIIPILGKHSQSGCWHHVEDLETLCREHHLEATAKQRTMGLFERAEL